MPAPANQVTPPSPGPSISFVASDIAEAIGQIRTQLGPDAIILDIRRAPATGLRRLWGRPRIEIVARPPDEIASLSLETTPDSADSAASSPIPAPVPTSAARKAPSPSASPPPNRSAPSLTQGEALRRYARAASPPDVLSDPLAAGVGPDLDELSELAPDSSLRSPTGWTPPSEVAVGAWRCRSVFDRMGLLPVASERVLTSMDDVLAGGRRRPETLGQELLLARATLARLWRPLPPRLTSAPPPLHVFLGSPGSGKSTVLCKWLAQTVLIESKAAQVWRLDGRTTNPSELVSLYGEILGVRVERVWNGRGNPAVTGFVDLGGVDFRDPEALRELAGTLARFSGSTVHLVLNAAYTMPILLAQVRAFSAALPIDDLILTHLDEEPAWGKLWNLVLGTNYPLSRLSTGQNVPGRFEVAQPELLWGTLFADS